MNPVQFCLKLKWQLFLFRVSLPSPLHIKVIRDSWWSYYFNSPLTLQHVKADHGSRDYQQFCEISRSSFSFIYVELTFTLPPSCLSVEKSTAETLFEMPWRGYSVARQSASSQGIFTMQSIPIPPPHLSTSPTSNSDQYNPGLCRALSGGVKVDTSRPIRSRVRGVKCCLLSQLEPGEVSNAGQSRHQTSRPGSDITQASGLTHWPLSASYLIRRKKIKVRLLLRQPPYNSLTITHSI